MVVDVQEGFRSYETFDAIAAACGRLVEGARILGVPVIATAQYPKGLGPIAPEVGLDAEPVEKTVFSAVRADGFDLGGRDQAVVCGIEAHICVSQTVHDLLEQGVEVHVASDAVGSRRPGRPRCGVEEDGRGGRGQLERRDGAVRALRAGRHARVQGRPAGDQVSDDAYLLLEDGTRLDGDAVGASAR